MRKKLYAFNVLLKKELLQLLKSPKSRIILFLPPIMQILIFGYAATMDLHKIDFAILDYSKSYSSRELSAKFTGNRIFRPQAQLKSIEDLKKQIDGKKIRLALLIPPDFERKLHSKSQVPKVQIIVDGRNSSSAGIALGYAQSAVNLFNRNRTMLNLPLTLESRAYYNPNYNVRFFTIPALLALLALLDLMLLTALAVAKEHEDGTFDQLRLTPYASWELLAAKGFSSLIVGLSQLSCGVLVAIFWFKVPFYGSLLTLYFLFLTFIFASIGNGLLISVLSKNLQQAILGCMMVAVPFSMLSGLATPIESMPQFFQIATLINPLRYGIKAAQRIFLEGATFYELMPTFGLLLAIGSITLSAAYIIFERRRG